MTGQQRGRTRPSAAERDAEDALLADLSSLYAEVGARLRDHSCEASTECCRFAITGREPYVTSVELLLLLRAVKKRGRRLSPASGASRKLPMVTDGSCPLLASDGRCQVYQARPFGCRTFFCERATTPDPLGQREVNAWVARLKEISEKHQRGGGVGRLLTRALSLNKS